VTALLTLKRIVEDKPTGDLLLLGPWTEVFAEFFPHTEQTALYAEFTSGHGAYAPAFHLRNMADEIVWQSRPYEKPVEMTDPLTFMRMCFFAVPIRFPAPGKYDVVWLLNDEEVARRAVFARYPGMPAPR
jgi:hypothetical protein